MPLPLKSLSRALVAALPLLWLGSWGCGLFESAQSDKVLAATVLATPAYDFSALVPDASFPFDSGVPLPSVDAGFATTLPSQTVAQVFFGQRNEDPTKQPAGLAGASVKLAINGKVFDLKDQSSGSYGLTTVEDPNLVFVPGVPYAVTVVQGGETFTATVQGPAEDHIEQFRVQAGRPLDHGAGQELQLTRSNTENIAFTTVFPLTSSGQGEPTYTNMPSTPLDLLDLIANDAPWKQKIITIPGTAFPQGATYYVVTIAAVKKGSTSNNLFTTSAFLAGKADMGLVKTR
ncbi:MAG: hypothetical protein HY901_24880 [Deltaproteobacteria bacterium]|nr:hypothetical protein [Deltaproteobacteria bacterium]